MASAKVEAANGEDKKQKHRRFSLLVLLMRLLLREVDRSWIVGVPKTIYSSTIPHSFYPILPRYGRSSRIKSSLVREDPFIMHAYIMLKIAGKDSPQVIVYFV